MNKYMKDIFYTLGTVAVILVILVQISIVVKQNRPIQGDMNNDGVLNITDLSILASVINEQG